MLLSLVLLAVMTGIYFNVGKMGQPAELLPLIRPYFMVSMMSVIFVMLANSFRQFVEGITDPSVSMWILLSGNLLNIIGNYVLIYGKLGFPEMGLLGAGYSTLFSRVFMLLMFVLVFLFRPSYKPYRQFFMLGQHLSTLPDKKVIFIDELPWLDTPNSKFVSALDHFWNGWATARKDIVLVVCSSVMPGWAMICRAVSASSM